MTSGEHRKALIKLLREASGRHNLWDVFNDFVTMAALAVANAVDLRQRDEREAEYMRMVTRYEPRELALFPQMLAITTEALEAEPRDFLGEVFGELELGNAARGQFFTPSELCRAMASITVGPAEELQRLVDQRGYIRVHEPACGAGAMLIAFAEEFAARGFSRSRQMHVVAIDVDRRAALMCYLQLSLLGIPAEIIVGNALTLECREQWFTPVHILEGWSWRLARSGGTSPAVEKPEPIAPEIPAGTTDAPPAAATPAAPQLTLF